MNILEIEAFNIIKKVHPHISSKLEILWCTEEFSYLVNTLLLDTREGSRKGFDPKVYKALLDLLNINDSNLPKPVKKPHSW